MQEYDYPKNCIKQRVRLVILYGGADKFLAKEGQSCEIIYLFLWFWMFFEIYDNIFKAFLFLLNYITVSGISSEWWFKLEATILDTCLNAFVLLTTVPAFWQILHWKLMHTYDLDNNKPDPLPQEGMTFGGYLLGLRSQFICNPMFCSTLWSWSIL